MAAGKGDVPAAWERVAREADRALERSPQAVVDFDVPGAYVDHEGHSKALAPLAGDAWIAYCCGVAYQLADASRRMLYADKAVEVLEAWAATNTRTSNHDGDLCMAYAGTGLVLAAELVADSDRWAARDRAAFAGWVGSVILGSCETITRRENNWGDWGILGCVTAHHFLDDRSGVEADIEHLRGRIDRQIEADGRMPLEIGRKAAGVWYTYFALAPLTAACQIAFNARGVDLFHDVGPRGGGVEKALDYLLSYCREPGRWPHHRGEPLVNSPTPSTWYGTLFEAMHGVYRKPAYGEWVRGSRPVMTHGHHYAWAVPTLLKPLPVGG
jgi:hypothetical protein